MAHNRAQSTGFPLLKAPSDPLKKPSLGALPVPKPAAMDLGLGAAEAAKEETPPPEPPPQRARKAPVPKDQKTLISSTANDGLPANHDIPINGYEEAAKKEESPSEPPPQRARKGPAPKDQKTPTASTANFGLPANHDISTNGYDATKKYAAIALPHLLFWNVIIATVKSSLEAATDPLATVALTKLEAYIDMKEQQTNSTKSLRDDHKEVKRVQLITHDKSRVRLEVHLMSGSAADAIFTEVIYPWIIQQEGVIEFAGSSQDDLERTIQEYLKEGTEALALAAASGW